MTIDNAATSDCSAPRPGEPQAASLPLADAARARGGTPQRWSPVGDLPVRDASEIERGIAAFALKSRGGLIVSGSPMGPIHRDLIVALAARHQLRGG
jgi:hypothetical protein